MDVSGEVCCDNELDPELLGGRAVADCGLFGEQSEKSKLHGACNNRVF